MQDIAWAAPELKPISILWKQDGLQWAQNFLPPIHSSVATIEDAHQSAAGARAVILIEDAHTNASCQSNTAQLLDIVMDKLHVRQVFVEAGTGDLSLRFLKSKAVAHQTELIAGSYLAKGQLQGSELANLTGGHDFMLYGVEDPVMYKRGLEIYRRVAGQKQRYGAYLQKIQASIDTLKDRCLNPLLLGLDRKTQQYRKGQLSITDYAAYLFSQSKLSEVPAGDYPDLKRLCDFKSVEAGIDFAKAQAEERNAVESLSAEDQTLLRQYAKTVSRNVGKIRANESASDRGFFALLEEKISSKQGQRVFYPELTKYFAYLKESEKIDPKKIFAQIEQLETVLADALAFDEDQKRLMESQRHLEILKKLYSLTLLPNDYEIYTRQKDAFD
ncbi:MAG: hypothetical protein WCG06_04520, partial [Candidatus Omnitrophota bacterium]